MFDIGEVHRNRYLRVKRLLDVALALPGLLALAAVTPVVLVGNAFGNRGPLLYRQVRVGKQGDLFEILKFRSMADAPVPADGSGWTLADDPRVTRFGRILRTTHLDELPQLINILRGELSVVGPRPEQPHYVDELVEKLPFYALRHLVRPGLTGWAQVKYHYASDEHDAMEKLQYEFFYLRHQSISLDLRIIGRTVRSVVGRGGR
jgi:lipopolysaccharide/colanic/teichoic acid biosynthesis glycosyltransferase